MSSTQTLINANELVANKSDYINAFNNPDCLVILHFIKSNREVSATQITNQLGMTKSGVYEILNLLEQNHIVVKQRYKYKLSKSTYLRLDYNQVDLCFLIGKRIAATNDNLEHPLPDEYDIKEIIGKGATSFSFKATQKSTRKDRVIKIFLPNILKWSQLDDALQKRASIHSDIAIPEVVGSGEVLIISPEGVKIKTCAVTLKYINGTAITFEEYLNSQDTLTPEMFNNFVERVGTVLSEIEIVGLSHGDLHERNILVSKKSGANDSDKFYVIDFIGVPSNTSPELNVKNDIENFKNHLIKAALIACNKSPGLPVNRIIGSKAYRVLLGLREDKYNTFNEMLIDFRRTEDSIPTTYFSQPKPKPFEWLRVEWIDSQDYLFKLFEPLSLKYEIISRFGNTCISGPRGCGKSHYLRVMAFHPEVLRNSDQDIDLENKLREINYDFKNAFGILFACRIGEFKSFTPEALDPNNNRFDAKTISFLKHIVILKIINRTLSTIQEGTTVCYSNNEPVIYPPGNVTELIDFLTSKFGTVDIFGNQASLDLFNHCVSLCIMKESTDVAAWYNPTKRSDKILNEKDLNQFFQIIKKAFSQLNSTRFYILVDDVSDGQICFEMQKILNSLVLAAQANHVFKITFEKYKYTLETSEGTLIDVRNDATYVDLGETVHGAKKQKIPITEIRKYMAQVVNSRLKADGFKVNIETIFGNSPTSKEFLGALAKTSGQIENTKDKAYLKKLPKKRAYYYGWNIISGIAHGSIRTLLELVEHIFKESNVDKEVKYISKEEQDLSIRSFSIRQYRAMSLLAGVYKDEPLGEILQSIISTIGEISNKYLREYNTGDRNRWYETISIQRVDRKTLDKDARIILSALIRNGYLVDQGVTFAYSKIGLSKRYDLNKIFAPALETTYRVKNHFYLNKNKFETLLLNPDNFSEIKIDELQSKRTNIEKPKQITIFSD